MNSEALKY